MNGYGRRFYGEGGIPPNESKPESLADKVARLEQSERIARDHKEEAGRKLESLLTELRQLNETLDSLKLQKVIDYFTPVKGW